MAVRKGHRVDYGSNAKSNSTRFKKAVPCRCIRCGSRKTIAHSPEWYSNNSKIPKCCGKLLIRDHYRATGSENKAQSCECSGYPFSMSRCVPEWKHRRRSLFCLNGGKAITAGFTWQDRDSPEFRAWTDAGRPATDAGEALISAHSAMAGAIPAQLSEDDYRLLDDAQF